MHLSGLARELKISKPVTSRHVKILEEVGLINKRIFGNTHLLNTRIKNLEDVLEPFIVESTVKVNNKKSIFDALKQTPGVKIKKVGKHQYIKSIDGENGYYIYEVNGELPKQPIEEYKIHKDVTLDLKKLVTVKKKKINVKVNKQSIALNDLSYFQAELDNWSIKLIN